MAKAKGQSGGLVLSTSFLRQLSFVRTRGHRGFHVRLFDIVKTEGMRRRRRAANCYMPKSKRIYV
jgi:hypothetical protein